MLMERSNWLFWSCKKLSLLWILCVFGVIWVNSIGIRIMLYRSFWKIMFLGRYCLYWVFIFLGISLNILLFWLFGLIGSILMWLLEKKLKAGKFLLKVLCMIVLLFKFFIWKGIGVLNWSSCLCFLINFMLLMIGICCILKKLSCLNGIVFCYDVCNRLLWNWWLEKLWMLKMIWLKSLKIISGN